MSSLVQDLPNLDSEELFNFCSAVGKGQVTYGVLDPQSFCSDILGWPITDLSIELCCIYCSDSSGKYTLILFSVL